MFFWLIVILGLYILWYSLRARNKNLRNQYREEMESLGKSYPHFFSPIKGKIKKIISYNHTKEFILAAPFLSFQYLRVPTDAELVGLKYFRPSKSIWRFWQGFKRKNLQMDFKVWIDDIGEIESIHNYSLICNSRWGAVLPIIKVGDLVKAGSKISLPVSLKLVKLKIHEKNPGLELAKENSQIDEKKVIYRPSVKQGNING
jgi:hypothetical protein